MEALLGNRKGSPPLPCYRRTVDMKWILEAGIDATWSGPEGSTHDVETSKKSLVKSTSSEQGLPLQYLISYQQEKVKNCFSFLIGSNQLTAHYL